MTSIEQQIANIEANLDKARNNTERQLMRSHIRKLQFKLDDMRNGQ